MTSTIHADKIMNSSGDQDSGVDLLVNDQVKIKTANTDRVTVTDATTTIHNNLHSVGTIIQTVASEFTTANVNPSANQTWTTVGPNVTITPKFSNSKILVSHSGMGNLNNTQYAGVRFLRGTTDIGTHWTYMNIANNAPISFNMFNLDNPATTNATTYYIQIWSDINYTQLRYNYYGQGDGGTRQSVIMAQEIAQ